MWDVCLSKQADKFLKKCDRIAAGRIAEKIEDLRENPFLSGIKRIHHPIKKLFRARVGDYRIVYEVDFSKKIMGIVAIDIRQLVYDF